MNVHAATCVAWLILGSRTKPETYRLLLRECISQETLPTKLEPSRSGQRQPNVRQATSSSNVGASFAHRYAMGNKQDETKESRVLYEQGATEERNEKIDAIVGDEVLGYEGSGRGEHSGQASEPSEGSLIDSLAHNRPEDVR